MTSRTAMRDRPRHVVLHATAYDALPSGARNRAVGLAAAFLRAGHRVTALAPRGLGLASLVADELGAPLPADRWAEVATGLDPRRPWLRALRAPSVVERATPADADLFLTDYQPVLDRVPTALTIHDLRYLAAPRWESKVRAAAFRRVAPGLVRRARWVVVPTAAVADEVVRHLDVERRRVVVAPNAVGRPWREAPPVAGAGRHLLVVGIAEPRKRFAALVAALREARRRGGGAGRVLPLVAVGRTSAAAASVLRGARDLVRDGALRWVANPSDDALVALVRDAAALLHPSAYEGFGMTALEAFACGAPVVAAAQAAVDEVAGGLATRIDADPGTSDGVSAWADALLGASASGAARCDGAAPRRARAASFTWDASAAAMAARCRADAGF